LFFIIFFFEISFFNTRFIEYSTSLFFYFFKFTFYKNSLSSQPLLQVYLAWFKLTKSFYIILFYVKFSYYIFNFFSLEPFLIFLFNIELLKIDLYIFFMQQFQHHNLSQKHKKLTWIVINIFSHCFLII
jgi:hypothetical protein